MTFTEAAARLERNIEATADHVIDLEDLIGRTAQSSIEIASRLGVLEQKVAALDEPTPPQPTTETAWGAPIAPAPKASFSTLVYPAGSKFTSAHPYRSNDTRAGYIALRADSMAARHAADTTNDPTDILERAEMWLALDPVTSMTWTKGGRLADLVHLTGLIAAAGDVGLTLNSPNGQSWLSVCMGLLRNPNWKRRHNFQTSVWLLAASLHHAQVTGTTITELADLIDGHIRTTIRNNTDDEAATHNSGRGFHYCIMNALGMCHAVTFLRTHDSPLPAKALGELERNIAGIEPHIERWHEGELFRWVAPNGATYQGRSTPGDRNRRLSSCLRWWAHAEGIAPRPAVTPAQTPYWSMAMPPTSP